MTRSASLVLCLLIFNGFDVCSSKNTVTVRFNTSTATIDEGEGYNIQLVAQGTFDQNFKVMLTFADGTAKFFRHYYYFNTPSVTFTTGSPSSSVFQVQAIASNAWGGTSSFQVRFKLPTDQDLNFNLESGKPDTLRVDIQDDDSVHISFRNSTQTVREDSGKLQLQLQSRGLYLKSFSVSFTCIPTEAKDGYDFTGGLYTVQFQAIGDHNTLSSMVEIPIRNDFIPESTECFTCVILKPRENGLVLDCLNTINIEIEDDDVPLVSATRSNVIGGMIHFKTSVVTIDEESYYYIQLVAQRTFDQKITVNLIFTDGTAKYPSDYFYDPLITPSVTFTPGSMSSSVFRVTAVPNNIWEGTRSFEVGFDLPSGQNLNSGKPGTLRVNIADDDSVHISFRNSTKTVREDSRSVQLQLRSRGLYGRRFSVSITCIPVFPTEAKDGDDFTGGLYTVQFGNLGASTTISSMVEIPMHDDITQESTEHFTCVILRPREDGIIADCSNTIDIKIEDDDAIEVSFEKSEYFGEEGSFLWSIRLNATRVQIPFSVQIVPIALDSSRREKKYEATSGVDYTDPRSLPGGVVLFSPTLGLLSSVVSISLLSDNIAEGTEYFGLRFVQIISDDDNPTLITPVDPVQAIVAINDTNEILVRFNSSKFEIDEDASSLDVYFEVVREVSPGVYLPAEYTFDFRLQVTTITVDGSATENVDFDKTVGSVTFSAGQQFSTPFSVKITDDTLCEGPEQFTVSYSIISSSVRSGANVRQLDTTATVVINDNDAPFVRFVDTSIDGVEGDVVSLIVNRSRPITRKFKCKVTTKSTTAIAGVDYRLFTNSIEFKRRKATFEMKTIYLQLLEDNLSEGKECFCVVLDCRPKDMTECYPPSATVCIQGN